MRLFDVAGRLSRLPCPVSRLVTVSALVYNQSPSSKGAVSVNEEADVVQVSAYNNVGDLAVLWRGRGGDWKR